MRAFRIARALGADGVELDVRLSADGVPVVLHDDTVDRTTCGSGAVASLERADLARLRTVEGEAVPTLGEAAEWAREADAWLNVELKVAGAEAASLAALEETGVLGRTILSSFLPGAVREVGRLAPEAHRYLLTERWDAAAREALEGSGAGGVCLGDDGATPEALRALAGLSFPVVVWTVDAEARIRALLRAGVAAVITNRPERGVRARASPGGG